jgi:ABC-type Fe3+/spermidine/putrescine transport system ATPase subunit
LKNKQTSIEQIGPPEDIYFQPASGFVASFIGESNVLRGTVSDVADDGTVTLVATGVPGAVVARGRPGQLLRVGDTVWAFVRAESIAVVGERPTAPNWIEGEIVERAFVGAYCRYHLRAPGFERILIADVDTTRARGVRVEEKAILSWEPADTILVRRSEGADRP